MHKYHLFEVFKDGTHFDTQRIISCAEPEFDGYGRTTNRNCVEKIFEVYRFNSPYINYYHASKPGVDGDFYINYNYGGEDGIKNTWFLKRIR